jgi:hypothetical protein
VGSRPERRRRIVGGSIDSRAQRAQPNLPTYDELIRDHAAQLKMTLGSQRDFCVEYFETQVLGLQPP